MKLRENIVEQYPTGRWGFVGSVRADLAYIQRDGSPATEEQLKKCLQFGPRLARLKTRTWPTEEAALESLGNVNA